MNEPIMNPPTSYDLTFLRGGGEMGALVRAFNWSSTSIGSPAQWPPSLRTSLSIVLNSRFPMFLFWGTDLICFYNDAYRPSLGHNGKHPYILGKRAEEAWPEAWHIIKPLIDQVMSGGEATWSEDQLIPIFRNGKIEDVYWTFSYSPVCDEAGNIAGVFVTCSETTSKVTIFNNFSTSATRFRNLVNSAVVATAVLTGRDLKLELANSAALKIWNKDESILGQTHLEFLHEDQRKLYLEILQQVFDTGESYSAVEAPLEVVQGNRTETLYFDFSYKALRNDLGVIDSILAVGIDVTEKVLARKKVEESEKRFRNVADTAPVLIWMSGTDKLGNYFNKAWLNFTGRTMEQELGLGWIEGVHPDDLQRCIDTYTAAFDRRESFYMEYRLRHNDGTYRWISDNAVSRFAIDGLFEGYIGACIDIHEEVTSRKKVKETIDELSKTTKRLQLALEAGKLGSFELDVTSGAIECTFQCKQDLGMERNMQLNYDKLLDAILPEDRVLMQAGIEAALKNNIPYELEFRIRWPDESVHWIYAAGIPFYNEDGNSLQIISVTSEITEQKLFEQALEIQVLDRTKELEQKNVELEKMNMELNSFAYVSSHDLQEPLRKIQTFSDRIIENDYEALSDKGRDYFRRMQAAAKRMQSLIEDLLAYSRTNNTDKVFEKMDLNQIVKEIRDDFKEQLQAKHATVIIESEFCSLNVIPFQFRQLIQNLISNALKFSSPERRTIITIKSKVESGNKLSNPKLDKDKRYCHLSISDNGIGFEPEYNEKIFEVFQRLHSSREYEGTGIGLAIVKKIVENHSGVITASGELNKGATFDVYIPA